MTVLHEDGLYRHLVFADPAGGFYRFDLVTWPHNLMLRGDGFSFGDFRLRIPAEWELSFQDFSWEFLFACHAVIWGIRQYDAAKAASVPSQREAGAL
ncbi:hypothetical protein IX27_17945 [Streptomyces sp. JS01]|uniref:hypothetical protein n=1 Tax=Streptomyces sp. JS01 TaxID=1525753 RepID=UPI000506FBF6|nr:hypothetical protein [Streptomyces sp. JS01]KFK87785.1 hypothetical protein IX27_17945 [Streptomyces sp. JS01]